MALRLSTSINSSGVVYGRNVATCSASRRATTSGRSVYNLRSTQCALGSAPIGSGSSTPSYTSSRPAVTTAALSFADVPLNIPRPNELSLGQIWSYYNQQLEERPLVTKAVVMALGLALGDVLASALTGAAAIMTKTLHMAAFGLLFQGPALHFLHKTLDSNILPSKPTSPPAVACKMAIDQLVFAPISTSIFLITMELATFNLAGVVPTLSTRLVPTLLASYTLWPLALIVNYGFIPPKQRILFVNFVTVVWSMVLSLLSSGAL